MKIKHNTTGLVRAGDVQIPSEFYSRLKTGVKAIDKVFGEGILPGMTFTISADPGCGKTTLMLQVCQALATQGYSAAYLSGEESQEQVAYSCARIKADDVLIACESNLAQVEPIVEGVDILIIDSFQSLHIEDDVSSTAAEHIKTDALVSFAKKHKTAIGIILHSTKAGTYKGSSSIIHAVDCNMRLEAAGENSRIISVGKNRYGGCGEHAFYFGSSGYDFDAAVEINAEPKGKSAAKQQQLNSIMSMTEPPNINVQRVCNELNIDALRANYLLRLLTNENKLQKFGRGDEAVWKFVEIKQLQTA